MVGNKLFKEFIKSFEPMHDKWVNTLRSSPRSIVLRDSYFPLAEKLNPRISSFQGYEITRKSRNQEEKNQILLEYFMKSLEEPTTIFDCGTYDGVRLIDLLEAIPTHLRKNIKQVFAIDINKEVLAKAEKNFQKSNIAVQTIHGDLQSIDMVGLQNIVEQEQGKEFKKILMGLENVFFNFSSLAHFYDQAITGYLSRITRPFDEVYMEVHHSAQAKDYAENVETFVKKYARAAQLLQWTGGKLIPEYNDAGKQILLTDMKDTAEFEGKTFHLNTKGNYQSKEISYKGIIELATSNKLRPEKLFEFLIFNYANNLYLESRQDIQRTDRDFVIKMRHYEDAAWLEHINRKVNKAIIIHRDDVYKEVTDYILFEQLYPGFYNDYFYQESTLFNIDKKTTDELRWKACGPMQASVQTSFGK